MDAVLAGDLPWASRLLHRHLDVASRIRTAFADDGS